MKRRRGAVPVGGGQGVFEADSGEAPHTRSRCTSGDSRRLDSILSEIFVVWCVAPVLAGSVVSIGTLVVDPEQGRRFPSAVPMFLQCTYW